ncbi:MAG: hypothetical protein KC543_12300 [Myxococcales bacterium]|nr:hypothetical protein [Myxococcales bacterium]
MESAILAPFVSLGVMEATTTPAERKMLTVGRMALLFPFAVPKLVERLLAEDEDEDEDEALALARRLRGAVLHGATDTNPKRTRQATLKRAQRTKAARTP